MRTLLLLILVLLALAPAARAAEILILQSSRSPAYDEALRGFRLACKSSEQTLLLSNFAEVDVPRMVKEQRPRLVLAVGDRALAAARKVRELPVVSVLSLSLNLDKPPAENVGGVTMAVAPEQYLKRFDALGTRRVGVLYDPKKTGHYLKRAVLSAREQGLSLVAEPVHHPRDLQAKLERLQGEVDVLWLLPDSTVVSTVNMEAMLLFSMQESVPAVTFTSHYLKNGAAAAMDIDHFDMGVQAGELASSLLRGPASTRRTPVLDPRKVQWQSNESVLRKLRLRTP